MLILTSVFFVVSSFSFYLPWMMLLKYKSIHERIFACVDVKRVNNRIILVSLSIVSGIAL